MWWNLAIFGKFAFEIFLVRVDYRYLWKTHFLNFKDFQESLNPLNDGFGEWWVWYCGGAPAPPQTPHLRGGAAPPHTPP